MEYERLAQVSMIILGKDKPVTKPGNSDYLSPQSKLFPPNQNHPSSFQACDWSTHPIRSHGSLQLVEGIKPRLD